MSNVNENSIEAFIEVSKDLTEKQEQVLQYFQETNRPATANMCSGFIGIPINAVTPRINELVYDLQLLKVAGSTHGTGKKRSTYTLRESSDIKNKRELSNKKKLEILLEAINEAETKSMVRGCSVGFDYLNKFVNENIK